jgi:hypothetical protein
MHALWRWSLVALPLLVIAAFAGLARSHATSTPGATAIVARIESATISASPGRVDAENTFVVDGVRASSVRMLSRSLDMNMGVTPYAARPLGADRWQVINAEVPMVGRWGIEIQALRTHGWVTVAKVAYYVPMTGTMHLLDRQSGAAL